MTDTDAPATVYADAPAMDTEARELVALAVDLKAANTRALVDGTPAPPAAREREFRLRKAAWLDRAAVDTREPAAIRHATDAALTFLAGECADALAGRASTCPAAVSTDGEAARAYVRREYRAWLAREVYAD